LEHFKEWEQQEDEGNQAFEAFRQYVDMGTDRSLAKWQDSWANLLN
jgi:hypothetical protein